MFAVRRSLVLIALGALLVGTLLSLAGCEAENAADGKFQWRPLFGDFTTDTSDPVAHVGEITITVRMVELFIDELPPSMKKDFLGPDGERLALKQMIDQVLMVQGAMDLKIYNDQDVARQLISQRRNTLAYAMRNYGLLRGHEPGEEELRAHFNRNKARFRQQGLALARHVECLNKADADLAYQRLLTGEFKNNFPHVVEEMSTNSDTKKEGGVTGWFTKGGFVPFIRSSEQFSEQVYDLEIGLHPPVQVADRWHVVEVTKREYERPQTFTEAKNGVMQDMLPAWQNALLKDYLLSARTKYSVEMLGLYAPGKGATAEELFVRAMGMKDAEAKLELLSMLHTDYPNSGKADDALFMSGNIALEQWQDRRVAERYFTMLINEYPDSELLEDTKFMLNNLGNDKVLNPQSIEDLRNN